MTELKTLKDFEEHIIGYKREIPFKETFLFNELKAEAVKWVKKWQKRSWTQNPEPAEAFIDFFNLTEEDLKEAGE